MRENDKIYSILQNLPQIKKEGKINIYALKYAHKSKKENYSISLPSNQNTYFITKFCDTLDAYKYFSCIPYDPVGRKEDTYEFLLMEPISSVWKEMLALINSSMGLKDSPHQDELPKSNLTLCELEYHNKKYWLGTRQQKEESLFKDKYPFLNAEGELKLIDVNCMLTLTFRVDFIVCNDEKTPIVYVLNRSAFEKTFHYYDLLKEYVQTKSKTIFQWGFLENPDFIQSNIATGYVFKGLARIIDDTEYLKQIKNTKPHTLKERLLEKCSESFSEEDFAGDKLHVTKSNLENVIKMLSKGFRYNFFSDKAEEW